LRDSLFFNIFGNAILFDNFEHGLAYRKYLVKTRQKPPTIYTLSGEKIGSNALMDPSPAARKPSQLEFVFGEPKTKHIAEMNTINGKVCNYCSDLTLPPSIFSLFFILC
jgi:hypothetical protein